MGMQCLSLYMAQLSRGHFVTLNCRDIFRTMKKSILIQQSYFMNLHTFVKINSQNVISKKVNSDQKDALCANQFLACKQERVTRSMHAVLCRQRQAQLPRQKGNYAQCTSWSVSLIKCANKWPLCMSLHLGIADYGTTH
jgi:hypothetical protein